MAYMEEVVGMAGGYDRFIEYRGGKPRARYKGAWYDAIIEALGRLGGCARLGELALELGVGGEGVKVVNSALHKMAKRGMLVRDRYGRFCLAG